MSWIESTALEPYPFFVRLAKPLGDRLGFAALPEVAHLCVLACAASFAAQKVSAVASPKVFRSSYPTTRVKRDDWDLHMVRIQPFLPRSICQPTPFRLPDAKLPFQVGWLYAFIATPVAIHLLRHPSASLSADPLYGVALPEQRLSAIAIGYFIWVRTAVPRTSLAARVDPRYPTCRMPLSRRDTSERRALDSSSTERSASSPSSSRCVRSYCGAVRIS